MDNYFECNRYPVLFMNRRKQADEAIPAMELLVEAEPMNTLLVYRCLLMRLLELKVFVDSTFISLLIVDFYNDTLPSKPFSLKISSSDEDANWLMNYRNRILTGPHDELKNHLEREHVLKEAMVKERIYFENILIHPIKIKINYTTSRLTRKINHELFKTRHMKVRNVLSTYLDVLSLYLLSYLSLS
jgi:hypothetical protein